MRKRYQSGDRLRPLALFEDVPRQELAAADPLFTQITLSEGREFIHRGDIGWEFFVLTNGDATVCTAGEEVARVGAGGFVGEVALLTGGRRNASVRAVAPITALVQSRREFRSLLRAAPTVAGRILAAANARA